MKILSALLTAGFLSLLISCSSVTTPIQSKPSNNVAVTDLLAQARSQTDAGEYEQSKASIERALRIESNNANLWFELAIVNKLQERYSEARSLALRARSLAQSSRLVGDIDVFIESLSGY